MITKAPSATCVGIQAFPVDIEVDVSSGLPQFSIVGLPDTSVKESKERVRSAIRNSGYRFPPEKITVNLAPADIKKEGPAYDLPIALGILAAGGLISQEALSRYVFLGELALDGSLRPFRGALLIAEAFKQSRALVLPQLNAKEAALERRAVVYPVRSLGEVVDFLKNDTSISPLTGHFEEALSQPASEDCDFRDVRGQRVARRAAEIAAAGAHNLLLVGSPGSGKTMIARRIPSLLPSLTLEESLEVTRIYSAAGLIQLRELPVRHHPFRNPHHGISAVAMAGGGSFPRPGEVSLAHHGILFLDELPEFRRDVIEVLRAPLEEGRISISRTKMQVSYPCRIMLVAAMNPCPCGYLMDMQRACRCSMAQIHKYQGRISGPILDRIDMHVEVPTLTYHAIAGRDTAESSATIRERVIRARNIQRKRRLTLAPGLNGQMTPREIKQYASPQKDGNDLLEKVIKELHLSARGYFKVLKVARTIADLSGEETIRADHIAEAIQYRSLDRQWNG